MIYFLENINIEINGDYHQKMICSTKMIKVQDKY